MSYVINVAVRLATRVAHSSPWVWKWSWVAVHQFSFLLPHDKSYYALRHFIAAAPDGLFLDVGANDGISALSLRKMDKNYRIFSLEPNPHLERSLQTIAASDSRFGFKMAAAGARASRIKFFIPSYHGIVVHPLTACDEAQARDGMTAVFGSRVGNRTQLEAIESDVIRVDDLAIAPNIIKIDAEGAELGVLQGAAATIARCRPFLMIEVAWQDKAPIVRLLVEYKYTVILYDVATDRFRDDTDTLLSPQSAQKNLFAVPDEKLADIAPSAKGFAV